MTDEAANGMVWVHDEPGYKGSADLLQEALSKWKPGRRSNEDVTQYKYPATGHTEEK